MYEFFGVIYDDANGGFCGEPTTIYLFGSYVVTHEIEYWSWIITHEHTHAILYEFDIDISFHEDIIEAIHPETFELFR